MASLLILSDRDTENGYWHNFHVDYTNTSVKIYRAKS